MLNVAVGKHAFTLALDKASDTSDIDHVNALSDLFVRRVQELSACDFHSVYGSDRIHNDKSSRVFEIAFKIPYLNDSEWPFDFVESKGWLKLQPPKSGNVNIGLSTAGTMPAAACKAPRNRPGEVCISLLVRVGCIIGVSAFVCIRALQYQALQYQALQLPRARVIMCAGAPWAGAQINSIRNYICAPLAAREVDDG